MSETWSVFAECSDRAQRQLSKDKEGMMFFEVRLILAKAWLQDNSYRLAWLSAGRSKP
ncbi:hypothetical protein [Microcystis phage Mwe-JY26]